MPIHGDKRDGFKPPLGVRKFTQSSSHWDRATRRGRKSQLPREEEKESHKGPKKRKRKKKTCEAQESIASWEGRGVNDLTAVGGRSVEGCLVMAAEGEFEMGWTGTLAETIQRGSYWGLKKVFK